jgi:purine-cytosine permease-like protein
MNLNMIKKQPWWQLLSIQTGGTLCLPVVMAGQLVCQKSGWLAGGLAVGLGNLFLLGMGYLLASLGTSRPQSTVEHAAAYFGNRGRMLFALVMMASMLGWFGIQLNVMALCAQQLLNMLGGDVPFLILNIAMGAGITCLMCFGMRTMKGLSYVSAPLLGATLLYAMVDCQGALPKAELRGASWLGGLSLIVGANIAAVIDLPTYFRHAASAKDARICILMLYGLIVPGIEFAGVYLSATSEGNTLLEILQDGGGLLWMLWICGFVLLSGWATNNGNLYSALASSYSLPWEAPSLYRTLGLGVVGTAFAAFNPIGHMEEVLDLLGTAIAGMGAVILAGYLFEGSSSRYRRPSCASLLSWLCGVTVGVATAFFGGVGTGVPALDAFSTSFLTQCAINSIYQRKNTYETING